MNKCEKIREKANSIISTVEFSDILIGAGAFLFLAAIGFMPLLAVVQFFGILGLVAGAVLGEVSVCILAIVGLAKVSSMIFKKTNVNEKEEETTEISDDEIIL